jgi:uncharacterized membrane protein
VSHLRHWALLVAALGAAGRAWFAFSAFVMPALDRLAPAQSIAAMNSINRLAVTPAFMTVLLARRCPARACWAWAVAAWGERPAPWAAANAMLSCLARCS